MAEQPLYTLGSRFLEVVDWIYCDGHVQIEGTTLQSQVKLLALFFANI